VLAIKSSVRGNLRRRLSQRKRTRPNVKKTSCQ
jgi:hypothetical protein